MARDWEADVRYLDQLCRQEPPKTLAHLQAQLGKPYTLRDVEKLIQRHRRHPELSRRSFLVYDLTMDGEHIYYVTDDAEHMMAWFARMLRIVAEYTWTAKACGKAAVAATRSRTKRRDVANLAVATIEGVYNTLIGARNVLEPAEDSRIDDRIAA